VFDTDFIVGEERFEDIEIRPSENGTFYWFYHSKHRHLIKSFILGELKTLLYVCEVTLIKKGEIFTPRFHFTVRHKNKPRPIVKMQLEDTEENLFVRASVNLKTCYENVWVLMSYFKEMKDVEIPSESFSLVKKDVKQIAVAIGELDKNRIKSIFKIAAQNVDFSEEDMNEMLKRKERLAEFKNELERRRDEQWWQQFFKNNKWIFGYGLNYVILRLEQPQPHVGGTALNGRGDQRSDYMAVTGGLVKFTVLVEIKTPQTPLLSGSSPIRNGAWSLSGDLTDALVQIHANIEMWNEEGKRLRQNREHLESKGVRTVKPKGIIVIGSLAEVQHDSQKMETFELFRKSIHGVEIITFDELFDRARFIIERE
jgi:hypothetical protein